MMRALLPILERFEGSRVKGRGSVWRIDGNSRTIQECKTQLLETICSQARPLVRYDEPPYANAELQGAVEVSANTWRLPMHTSGSALLSWLYMGNWQLYVADSKIEAIPDLCRSSDNEVNQFVAEAKVRVVIDSFHDDVSWVVGLGRDAQQPIAADAPKAARR